MSTHGVAPSPAPKRSNVVRVLHWGDQPAPIRCLIGSTRYKAEYLSVAKAFASRGEIVLAPHVYADANGINAEEQEILDEMTLKRIDMSDIVYVINPNNRIPESVYRQIDYAESLGRTVMYLEAPGTK